MTKEQHETDAQRALRVGVKYRYAPRYPVRDAADRAALAICYDLCDRGGIKWEMQKVDDSVRRDIVKALAAIIRETFK